jgi:hypothetical protein
MKTILASLAAISLVAICTPAAAANYYGSIGYAQVDADDASLGAVAGRVGWQSDSFWGVEAEAAVGTSDETIAGVDYKIEHALAVYGVARYPVAEGFEVLARLGYGTAKVKNSGSDDGVAFGVGAQYNWGANGVRGDFSRTRADLGSGVTEDVNAWAISFVRKF